MTDLDLDMPVGEALRLGKVMRVGPKLLCGSRSPETQENCRLEPDHIGAHLGIPSCVMVGWA